MSVHGVMNDYAPGAPDRQCPETAKWLIEKREECPPPGDASTTSTG